MAVRMEVSDLGDGIHKLNARSPRFHVKMMKKKTSKICKPLAWATN